MTAANDNLKDDYDDPWSRASEAAKAAGRNEAVNTIYEKGTAVCDTAHSGQASEAARKAEGALCIWRAAYAAAYREMLAIEDQNRAYAAGGGIPDTILEHPKEVERYVAGYTSMKAERVKIAAEAPQKASECDDDEWLFSDAWPGAD